MAISIRRAVISCRNIFILLRSCRQTSRVPASPYLRRAPPPHQIPNSSPQINFLFESRRFFAKGRKQWDDDDDGDVFRGAGGGDDADKIEIVNVGPNIKSAAVSEMEAAIAALSHDLSKLRTGRASEGMLDHIIVETGGVKMPLNRMAVVSVLDPQTLSVTPYNPSALKELEKAIISSPLGLNPKPEGERLITAIPPMSKENVQAVCRVISKSAEDVKQRIRRARQKALDTIKKSLPKKEAKDKRKDKDKDKDKKDKGKEKAVLGFSADDAKRLEKEVEELTKKFTKSAEELCKAKEKEITS